MNHVISGMYRRHPLSMSGCAIIGYFFPHTFCLSMMAAIRSMIPRSAALRTAQPMLRASQPAMRRYSSSLTPNAEAAKEFVEHRQHAFEHAGSTYGDTK